MQWVPVGAAAVGALGALFGVFVTQWVNRRTQRENWVREDRALTFELRREAYVEFYKAAREAGTGSRRTGMSTCT
jgi:hypothetical protein